MDFGWSEEQGDVRGLVRSILSDHVTAERMATHEQATGPWVMSDVWSLLAASEVLGVGEFMGFTTACILAEECGRVVAPLPIIEHIATTSVGLASGTVSHGALVPWAGHTSTVYVLGDDVRRVSASELDLAPVTTTAFERFATADIDVASAEVIGEADLAKRLRQHLAIATCAYLYGLSRAAMIMTAKFVSERRQFGVPLATFQAVAHRAADMYIDTDCAKVAWWQAAWRLEQGLPADRETRIASTMARDMAHSVTTAAQHLHGGMGFDRDYPLHRYYLLAKRLELASWLGRT
jgi:3-oxocholest-4-en-26-oyl-CoA dehydrogenase beta subunit